MASLQFQTCSHSGGADNSRTPRTRQKTVQMKSLWKNARHSDDMTDLLSIQSLGRVKRLYQRGRMADEQRVARSSCQHADHGQPHVGRTLWRIASVTDAQHVRQGLE